MEAWREELYSNMSYTDKKDLTHYGVPGMKWGVRKQEPTRSSPGGSSRPRSRQKKYKSGGKGVYKRTKVTSGGPQNNSAAFKQSAYKSSFIRYAMNNPNGKFQGKSIDAILIEHPELRADYQRALDRKSAYAMMMASKANQPLSTVSKSTVNKGQEFIQKAKNILNKAVSAVKETAKNVANFFKKIFKR